MTKVALISLGCAKNLVDSEVMLGALKRSGFTFVDRPEAAEIIVVNTCGFIRPARDEAEEALGRALALKRRDPGKKIVAAGCYVALDRPSLEARFPGVDAWTGVANFDRIADLIDGRSVPETGRAFLYSDRSPRLVTTPAAWAYVKVSEGCSHRCAFCSIPRIKGPYASRSMASVVREARTLSSLGIREIDLVSQDTTFYGRDRGLRGGLVKLIGRLARVEGVEWIRILYGYPEEITDALLDAMKDPKVCRYLDIPFQHADPAIVKAMKRGLDGVRALRLLDRIRSRLPGVAVRTTLIVGFPGEGPREFRSLVRFVEEARFDHLGVFSYSPEERTAAFALGDPVPRAEKERRRAEIMTVQAGVSLAHNRSRVGTVQDVLIEGRTGRGGRQVSGRAGFQAPEVDGLVRITLPHPAMSLAPIVKAEVVAAGPYDLEARLVA
jgi:ribosomal protein S12 methylthiotransferase